MAVPALPTSAAAERQADVAGAALQEPRPVHFLQPRQRPLPPTPPRGEGGRALAATDRALFEPRLGVDLGAIRLHADLIDAVGLRHLGARALAHRGDIWLRPEDDARPEVRRRLLAHELAHLMQPEVARGAAYGRSVDDWLQGSPDIRSWGYTALLSEIDELQAWQERQTRSSVDSSRVGEALDELRREVARRDRETRTAARARPRRGRSDPALPARRPRVLDEPTTRVYSDPAQMRAEYDLIMEWLARRDLPRPERRILELERDNLAPQFTSERSRVAGEARVARVRAALTPNEREAGQELQVAARVISGIVRDDANPNLYWIYQNNERIGISAEQANRVRTEIDHQLRRASRMINGDAEMSWDTYQSQLAVNRDSPIIAAIAGWLGGASDPGDELRIRRATLTAQLRGFDAAVATGDFVAAASRLGALERQGQIIHGAAAAFRDQHIEGAERAVGALEITRDVSFAIAGSIAAVVAAPLVAGAVAGAGLTGGAATVATIGGTGLVVGSGEAVVRGGSSAGGVLLAGGTAREAGQTLLREGRRGAIEGFMAGAGGSAAGLLGPALGVGGQVGGQVLRRIAAEAIVNGTTATVDALIHGATPAQAARAGVQAAVLSVPGAVVGGANSRIVRELGAPFAAGATAYVGAIASGQSRDEALRAATVAVTSAIVMNRVQHGSAADERLSQREQALNEAVAGTGAPAASPAAARTGIRVELEPATAPSGATPVTAATAGPADLPTGVRVELEAASSPPAAATRADDGVPAPMPQPAGPASQPAYDRPSAPARTGAAEPSAGPPSTASPAVAQPEPSSVAAPTTSGSAATQPESHAAGAPSPTAASAHLAADGAGGRRFPVDDAFLDEAFGRLEQDHWELNIGERRRQDIIAGRRDFAGDRPVGFDVDEPAAVGASGIGSAEASRRARDVGNRQLLDPATNQRTKYLGEEVRTGGPRAAQPAVSVADQPSAVITRPFDEVVEMRQLFDEAVTRARIRPGTPPTAEKAAINRAFRDLLRSGQSPAARAVRGALQSQGFQFVEGRGFVAVRVTP